MRSNILVALVCSAAWFASPAVAQTSGQEAAETPASDEIIVTATRDSRSLQDVPMSVDVATGESLQSLNLFDAKDVQQLSPGLELTNADGRSNTTSLRGISFNPDQGTSPAVQVYMNEVPADAQTVYTALYDIAQIEVLRGPQGTLRGLSSPAGAITISTRRPGFDEIGGYVQAAATDLGGYNVQGGVTLPFSSSFAIRAAMLVDGNRVNHVRNVNRGDRSQSRTQSGRLTLGWQPSDAFTGYLTYQYLTADTVQYPQVFGAGNTPDGVTRSGPAATQRDRIAVVEGPTRFQNETHLVNLNLAWDLGPVSVSFIGGHQDSLLTQARDQDTANAVPGYVSLQANRIPFIVNTAELRLASNGGGVWNWGLGAFYSKQTGTSDITQAADSFFAPAPIGLGLYLPVSTQIAVPVNQEIISFNASSRLDFGQIKLEGGIRYSIIRNVQRADIRVISPGFAGFPPFGIPAIPGFDMDQEGIPAALQRQEDKPITGGASISWEPSPDFTVYGSYAHSFRQGSAGVAVPVGLSSDLIRSGAEKTDSFEVGFKARLIDRRLNLNVAAYYQKYDGFLSRFTGIYLNCPDFFGTCNAFGPPINNATDSPNGVFDFNYNGDATVKGVEATIEGTPIDIWDFSISASYSRGRYDDARLPCNDFNGDGRPDAIGTPRITGTGNVSYCVTDGRVAELPDFSFAANSELRFPVGDLTPFVRGNVSHRPAFSSDVANFRYPARTMLNAFAGIRGQDDRWELNVFARNLLNQQQIISIGQGNVTNGTQTPGLFFDSGYRTVSLMSPREFGVTASFRW